MSDGDDTSDEPVEDEATGEEEAAGEDEAGGSAELSTETVESRLDEAESDLEAAETEADLDAVEETLDDVAATLEGAAGAEDEDADEEDEDDEDGPVAELQDRVDSLRSDLEDQRGPYAEDVTALLADAESTLTDAEWTDDGEREAVAAVETFLDAAGDALGEDYAVGGDSPADAADAVETVRSDVETESLDPDDDAKTIESLLEAAETLESDLEEAEVWSDLTIREQLGTQGFYDVLTPENRKDFPPEWNAIKIYAEGREPEPILTALERYESDFMEEYIYDALARFAPSEAVDPLLERAERRDADAIRILGLIGDERASDTIVEFLGGGDVTLEQSTLRALGAIGDQETTQAVANRLDADNPEIRSTAARALGMLGDTRAIDPLADVLHDDDADAVRASAAWALNQIGTDDALDELSDYAGDRSYIVQAEAEKASGA